MLALKAHLVEGEGKENVIRFPRFGRRKIAKQQRSQDRENKTVLKADKKYKPME